MNRGAAARIEVESTPEQREVERPSLRIAIAPGLDQDIAPVTEVRQESRFSPEFLNRLRLLRRLRPAALGSLLVKLFGPDDRRRIIPAANGLRIYADPFSHLGGALLVHGVLESDTEEVFRKYLRPGETFLDIGANEGYFSALAGKLVGQNGLVIAVEPQSRLRDIIELNLRINNTGRYRIHMNAFGGRDGDQAQINLWPSHNTGASSIVSTYRFSRKTETVQFVSLERIFAESRVDHVDFAKVDVEGFEGEVVRHLVPFLRAQRVKTLFLDYHAPALARMGIDPCSIHQEIVDCGYRMVEGDENHLESYRLYQPTDT